MTSRLQPGRARHSVRAALRQSSPLAHSRRAGECAPYLAAMLLLLAWQKVCAQYLPAEDFFNAGAQLYISNNIPAALERVEMGLKTYPDNEKLQKLEKLLKQQQQNHQNQQQQSQQDQKQQDKKDQQQKQDQKQQQDQQKNSEQQKQDQQKQSDQNKNEDQQKQQEQKKDSGDKPKDEQGQPVKAGEMTPEQAKRLLDAQKGNEQLLQMKPDGKPRDPSRPVKDW
jgi:Skp family chaperone for outer membrane proteins